MFLKIGFAAFAAIFAAQAGPPLICQSYNIGTAPSLPWGNNTAAGWDNPDSSYNTKQLSADTLKLLDARTPVLARMETLRRATIYGEKDHAAAAELLSKLRQRAAEKPNALALFDYGYFVESIKEMQWRYKDDLTAGIDGSAYVNKALALMPDSAEIHSAVDRIKAGKRG
ncbi:MAG: hypothetical protein ACR2NN_23630 [Bryobacteraceae bacterium]